MVTKKWGLVFLRLSWKLFKVDLGGLLRYGWGFLKIKVELFMISGVGDLFKDFGGTFLDIGVTFMISLSLFQDRPPIF